MCGCAFGLEGMIAVGPMKPCGHYNWAWPDEAVVEEPPSALLGIIVGIFIGLVWGLIIGLVIA